MIVAGIDEAGYGPRLGPLVVAASALRTPEPENADAWPACRFLDGKGPVVVCDSKVAYAGGRGLAALESAVFGFAAQCGPAPASLAEFVESFVIEGGAEALARPWYGSKPVPLPLALAPAAGEGAAAYVGERLAREGFAYLGTRLCVVDEGRFNDILYRTGNKSVLLFGRNAILMRRLWESLGGEGVHLTVDRHGGRKFYGGLLDMVFPEAGISVLSETDEDSAYVIDGGGRRMCVRFTVRSESVDSAAALSSMWAKYARELFMHVFNEYWLSRAGGLAPTAGYWVDAERFMNELVSTGAVTAAEVEALTRWK